MERPLLAINRNIMPHSQLLTSERYLTVIVSGLIIVQIRDLREGQANAIAPALMLNIIQVVQNFLYFRTSDKCELTRRTRLDVATSY